MTQRLGRKFKLGLAINPFAGIGGALALKGSDGKDVRQQALAQGAEQLAMSKAQLALNQCQHLFHDMLIYTGSGDLGESVALTLGIQHKIVYSAVSNQTEMDDTLALIQALEAQKVDLILFAGGDGTARNLCQALVNHTPVLGVPAGCKIHSGVYAISPKAAGIIAAKVISGELLSLQQAEVRDIDEGLFRQGKVVAKHFGELNVPNELNYIQAVKMGGKESDELLLDDIADYILEIMDEHPDTYFVMGSGSTVDAIMQRAGLPNTLLGVDILLNGEIQQSDVTAQQLLQIAQDKPIKLVITLIGGQGHIFGRGNQQISPEFIRRIGKHNIIVVATKAKLNNLHGRGLISDSGDHALDKELAGPIPVITGYKDHVLYFVQG